MGPLSTAGAAWALAHYGAPDRAALAADSDPMTALRDLPVAGLRLDHAVVVLLERLGLKTIGDLAAIGRPALARDRPVDRAWRLTQGLRHRRAPMRK